MPLNDNETRALIAHVREGGAEGENAERLLAQLTPYSPFMRTAMALIEAHDNIPALRSVSALAKAMQAGAKAQGMGIEAENVAAEVVLRSRHAIGLALIGMAERGERVSSGQHRAQSEYQRGGQTVSSSLTASGELHTVDSLGVKRNDAQRWQALARIPDFDAQLEREKAAGKRISHASIRGPKTAGEDAAPVDPLYAALRRAYYLAARDPDGGLTGNAFAHMHVDDLRKSAELIQKLAVLYQARVLR